MKRKWSAKVGGYCSDNGENTLDLKNKKSRKSVNPENIIKIGDEFEKIKVIGKVCGNKKLLCRCLECGKEYESFRKTILNNKNYGCQECAKKKRKTEIICKRIEEYRKEIGEMFGELTVIDVVVKTDGQSEYCYICKCDCGNVTEISRNRVRAGQAKTCGHDRENNLVIGKEKNKKLHVEGTYIKAIDGSRKINKNNTTGHVGVSRSENLGGLYRAYINFKRKQYSLGVYEKIEDAIKAREVAEKEIYGNFLEWYGKEHLNGAKASKEDGNGISIPTEPYVDNRVKSGKYKKNKGGSD